MSKQTGISKFTSSEAKNFIRDIFDFEIIRAFKHEYYQDQQLAYLGLPGEDLLDVLSWRQFIGRWTGVQIADTPGNIATAERMIHKVLWNRMERGFELIRADIDDLLDTEAGQQQLKWPYHVVNLDYYGGLVNAAENRTSRRLNALRGLFARQADVAFLLFLTLNLRDRDRGELTRLVDAEEEELSALEIEGVTECFAAHREFGHAGELKIYVPIFLGANANRHTLIFHPPILYHGTQQMIHFAVHCIPYTENSSGRIFRTNDHLSFINLPLHLLHSRDDLIKVEFGHMGVGSETEQQIGEQHE
jgi:hypothetical protein